MDLNICYVEDKTINIAYEMCGNIPTHIYNLVSYLPNKLNMLMNL